MAAPRIQYIFLYPGGWSLAPLSYIIYLSLGLGFLKKKEETISLNLWDGGTLDEMCRKMPNPILG